MKEKDIQEYIWKHRGDFNKILQSAELPQRPDKSPWEYSPTEILYYHLIDKYKGIWEAIEGLDMFGCEVPLKKDGDSTIRADFLGILEGENGIVIVELKKMNKPNDRHIQNSLHMEIIYETYFHLCVKPMWYIC